MKKVLILTVLVAGSIANAADFKLTPARVGDTTIRRYDDKDFAAIFNYLYVQKAYPYVDFNYVKTVPSNSTLKEICKKSTLKILKTPGAAKFPKIDDAIYSAPGGIYYVNGEVDSQNSYGALLRSKFNCTMVFEGTLKGGKVITYAELEEK